MISLQKHIDEALFSKKESDPKKIADNVWLDSIKKYSYDEFDRDMRAGSVWAHNAVRFEDGGLVIDLSTWPGFKTGRPVFIIHNAPACVFPLNIKKIINPKKEIFTIQLVNCGLKSVEDVFAPGFEYEGSYTDSFFIVQDCKNFISLKGFPQNLPVRSLMVTGCPMKSFKYMPKNPTNTILYMKPLSRTGFDVDINIFRDECEINAAGYAKEILHELDPSGKMAQFIKKKMGTENA